MNIKAYLKTRNIKQLRKECKELDSLIFGENSCSNGRDFKLYLAIVDEIYKRLMTK